MNPNEATLRKTYTELLAHNSLSAYADIIREAELPPTCIADLMYICVICKAETEIIQHFRNRHSATATTFRDTFITELADHLRNLDLEHSSIIAKLATIHNAFWNCSYELSELPPLPITNHEFGAYVDVASGPDFVNYFSQFNPSLNYYAIDPSYFVYEVLLQKSALLGIDNFTPINKRLDELVHDDIPEDIIAIRMKNVRGYIDNQEVDADKLIKWLVPGGKLAIQDYSSVYDPLSFFFNQQKIISKIRHCNPAFIEGSKANPLCVHSFETTKIAHS